MEQTERGMTRREALLTAAKVAGTAAFVAPVVVSVFAAPAFGQSGCNPGTNSRAVPALITAGTSWNSNCAGNQPGGGRYNGQNKNFTLNGVGGTVNVGDDGTDNTAFANAFYVITSPANYNCVATFHVDSCNGVGASIVQSNPAPPHVGFGLPYCTNCSGSKLVLDSIVCCPI